MLSLADIQDLQAEAAAEAAKRGRKPLQLWRGENPAVTLRKIPNLGNYVPAGFHITRLLFVDSSGWGRPGEPAFTFEEFCQEAKPGRYYAIWEEGQFQIHVAEYVKGPHGKVMAERYRRLYEAGRLDGSIFPAQ